MKQIKIVTYCTWTSIGSILQSLGLKKALKEIGYESCIWLNQKDNCFTKDRIYSAKSFVKRSFEIIIHKKRCSNYQKRMSFISRNIDIEYFSTYTDLQLMATEDNSDCIVAGSDQIWNTAYCNPVFFLDFVKNKKRISYAASMGKNEVYKDQQDRFRKMVNNFDAISVREQECANVIGAYTDKNIEVHIDPTFLVNAEEWRKYERTYQIHKPYILLYMLYWDSSYKKKIKKLKKETGLPVYAIANGLSRVYADKVLYDVGVDEFLWLVDHSEYVVTSSFHGVAFSVIFNKKFAPVISPSAPSRIVNLLRTLSVPLVDVDDLASPMVWDYSKVNSLIANEKERSMQYLKRVL